MNFDAIFKNAKIVKIGLLEAKLWEKKINLREMISFPVREMNPFPVKLCNFASRGPILEIFTFLKMALKFIGSSNSTSRR